MRCWICQCCNVQTYGRWTRYSNAECVAAKEEEVVDNICAILTVIGFHGRGSRARFTRFPVFPAKKISVRVRVNLKISSKFKSPI